MFGLLGLVLAVGSAFFVLRRWAGDVLGGRGALAASVPLSLAGWAFLASWFLIFLSTRASALASLFLMIALGAYAFFDLRRKSISLWADSAAEKLSPPVFIFGIILFTLFLFLIFTSFFVLQDGSWSIAWGGPSADIPYHLSQVIRMGVTERWDFEEPSFAGEFIRYPYFINLVSGVLFKSGAPLDFAMHLPIFLLAVSAVGLLILLLNLFEIKGWFAVLLLAGIFFGGGLAYLEVFQGGVNYNLPLRTGASYPTQNISYPGLFPGFLVHQRPFFLGFALFLLALYFLIQWLRQNSFRALAWSGIMAGLMPFAHMHSFLALALVAGSTLLYLIAARDGRFFDFTRGFVFTSFFLAMPQLAALVLLPQFPLGNVVSFRLGWMSAAGAVGSLVSPPAGGSLFVAWLRYMGTNFSGLVLAPFLVAYGFFSRQVRSHPLLPPLGIAAIGLWVMPNFFLFQTWDFDTNKFFSYAILLSLIFIGAALRTLSSRRARFAAAATAVLLIAVSLPTSFIAIARILSADDASRLRLLTANERAVADWIRINTAENASIVSSAMLIDRRFPVTYQKNSIVSASGRRAAAGSILLLYTHGIDYAERNYALESFLLDPAGGAELLKGVPADYVLIDPLLRAKYPELEARLKSAGYPRVFAAGATALYTLAK